MTRLRKPISRSKEGDRNRYGHLQVWYKALCLFLTLAACARNIKINSGTLPAAITSYVQPSHQQDNEFPAFPSTRFTGHIEGILRIIEEATLPVAQNYSTKMYPWPYDPCMYCKQAYRIFVDKPYSPPSKIECNDNNSWCSLMLHLFQNTSRVLPYNVTFGEAISDMIKPQTMPWGNCLGSSATKGQFSMNNFEDAKEQLLFYDPSTLESKIGGYAHDQRLSIPWEQRRAIPVFRGDPRMPNVPSVQHCPRDPKKLGHRVHAAVFSLDHPELLDAVVSLPKYPKPTCVETNATLRVEEIFRMGPYSTKDYNLAPKQIPKSEYYTNYQTAVVLGGIGAAFRLARHLSAGQAVVLQDYLFEEWFTPYMTPGYHYIPLKQDLTNMTEVMEWVRDHPQKVKEIGENGRKFYWDYLSFVQNEDHWHEFLWRLGLLIHEKGPDRLKTGIGRETWPWPFVPATFVRGPDGRNWQQMDVQEFWARQDASKS